MRTTLSLDDDVAAQLEQFRARGDRSFRQLVNDALRAGLAQIDRESAA
ncbi:MAG: ribbon-helix-helix protein, CopG family, partial [Actinobacteria bacterium]|nr:ribbon-helix-helix protein, CopG family [Actinomycetota bacterium]